MRLNTYPRYQVVGARSPFTITFFSEPGQVEWSLRDYDGQTLKWKNRNEAEDFVQQLNSALLFARTYYTDGINPSE